MIDCTILLQGRIEKECLDLWIKHYSKNNVVLSIWEDEDVSEFIFPNNWKIIFNQYPIFRCHKTANLDYQLITTIRGLNNIKTDYTIKARCDEFWSNIEKVYEKIKFDSTKLVTASIYFRQWYWWQFHCSDKIIGSKTKNLLLCFNKTIENLQNGVWDIKIPECQIGLAWVMVNEKRFDLSGLTSEEITKTNKKNLVDHKSLMRRYFDIVNVNDLYPFISTRKKSYESQERVWYRNPFNHKKEECLTDINEN